LRDYYEKKFPAWDGIDVTTFSRIGQGSENEVYSFRLGYEEAGEKTEEDLILRIYPGDGGDEKSNKEFSTMKYLHSVDYPVPQMKFRESDPSVLGKPFVVMEKVPGPLMGDIFFESSRQKRRKLLDLFCRMFVRLHRLDWRAFVQGAPLGRAQDPHLAMLDKISQVQEVFHSLDKTEFDPVFDWLRRQSASLEFDDPSLIHWDYHPWNIIMRDDATACVIDWTQAEVLDFRFDLGWTLVLVSTHAHPWLARAVLRRYEQIAGARVRSIGYFEVAACLKRLFAASAFLTHGPERIGMRPGAEVVLKDHAPPLRRVYAMLRRKTQISIPEVETFLQTLR
jgi:aminoglycoside phosphotransferase (APT) family kinase protein